MPRRARFCPGGYPAHLIQRGNNRQAIFTCDADLAAYANWLAEGAERFGVSIHGWVFMTNHVHLLIRTGMVPLATLMRRLLTGYAVSFNRRHRRHGQLFQNRYKSILRQEDAYLPGSWFAIFI